MPIYKGTNEVASGNLYKGTTEIQDGYKGTNSFYVNEVSISWLNFPGVTDYIITGAPGDTIGVSKSVSWTETAPGGSAYNGTQTATGVPTGFSFTGGQQGNISYTTTSPSVSFDAATFPNTSTSVDYNNLTVTLPTSTIVTNSYVFTGTLVSGYLATSCQAFSGGSCSVSTVGTGSSWNRGYAGDFSYWNGSASGTGGYGAGRCYQGCSVSISSSGGTSVCDTNSGKTNQPLTGNLAMACNVGYSNPPASGSVWSNFYCVTPPDPNGQADGAICGDYQISTKPAYSSGWAGGGQTSSSCAGTPTPTNYAGWQHMGYGGQSVVWDTHRGTWEVRMTSYQGTVMTSASCVVN